MLLGGTPHRAVRRRQGSSVVTIPCTKPPLRHSSCIRLENSYICHATLSLRMFSLSPPPLLLWFSAILSQVSRDEHRRLSCAAWCALKVAPPGDLNVRKTWMVMSKFWHSLLINLRLINYLSYAVDYFLFLQKIHGFFSWILFFKNNTRKTKAEHMNRSS